MSLARCHAAIRSRRIGIEQHVVPIMLVRRQFPCVKAPCGQARLPHRQARCCKAAASSALSSAGKPGAKHDDSQICQPRHQSIAAIQFKACTHIAVRAYARATTAFPTLYASCKQDRRTWHTLNSLITIGVGRMTFTRNAKFRPVEVFVLTMYLCLTSKHTCHHSRCIRDDAGGGRAASRGSHFASAALPA